MEQAVKQVPLVASLSHQHQLDPKLDKGSGESMPDYKLEQILWLAGRPGPRWTGKPSGRRLDLPKMDHYPAPVLPGRPGHLNHHDRRQYLTLQLADGGHLCWWCTCA